MDFIRTKNDLIDNIETLEKYLVKGNAKEQKFAKELVKKGEGFVVYKVDGENHFAPGRFVAYKNNSMSDHTEDAEPGEKETNSVIEKVLKLSSFANEKTDDKYINYVESLGVKPSDTKRSYWRLKEGAKNVDLSDFS